MVIRVASHPLLAPIVFRSVFPRALGSMETPSNLRSALQNPEFDPKSIPDDLRADIRALLRAGGFRPSGRSKPSSEYLAKAAGEGRLSSINVAVDVCNITSLQSGFPISVIDLDRSKGPWSIGLAEPKSSYIFNPAGQSIDIGQLLCLFDAHGPCANAVKDAQRTKTCETTTQTLSVIWGTTAQSEALEHCFTNYRKLLDDVGAEVERLPIANADEISL